MNGFARLFELKLGTVPNWTGSSGFKNIGSNTI